MKYDLDQVKDLGNGYVMKTGLIFRAGDYPDKNFRMTAEELKNAADAFTPVDLDIEHRKSIFDGKLGKLHAVVAKGDELYGAALVPKWLHEISEENPIKVSCTWDRSTKKLSKLALVTDPRVSDAALMAAFSKSELEAGASADKVLIDFMVAFSKTGERTWAGQDVLQQIHEITSKAGAVCSKSNAEYSEFVSKPENKAIQDIHDMATSLGASCYVWETDAIYNQSSEQSERKEDFNMGIKEKLMEIVNSLNGTPEAQVAPVVEEQATSDSATRIAELEAEVAKYSAKLEALEAKEAAPVVSEKEAALSAQLEELQKETAVKEAGIFANDLVSEGKATPAEAEFAKNLFIQLLADDKNQLLAEFNTEGNSRVEMLKAFFQARETNKLEELTTEKVEDAIVLSNDSQGAGDAKLSIEEIAAEQVKAYLSKSKAI